MNYIFWGFFFVILDFNYTSGNTIIGFLPTFIGYILLHRGLTILAPFSFRFVKIQSWTIAMAAYMGLVYCMNLFGVANQVGGLFFFLGLGATLVGFYIQFNVAMGIKDIELNHAVFLNADTLILLWKIVAVGMLLGYVTLIIPPIALLIIVAAVVANVIFLYYLSKTRRAFDAAHIL